MRSETILFQCDSEGKYQKPPYQSINYDTAAYLSGTLSLSYGPINDIKSYPFSLPTLIMYSIR